MGLDFTDEELDGLSSLDTPGYGPWVNPSEGKRLYEQPLQLKDLDRTLVRISEHLKGLGFSDELHDALTSVKPHKAVMTKAAKVRLLAKLRIVVMDHAEDPLLAVSRFDR